ncbi:MAG: FISUMP domain-containing protein [Bacteroidales bacterium]
MKKFVILLILIHFSGNLFCQIDNQFWFVAPDISSTHGDSPINIRLSSMSDPVNYLLTMPADPSFAPISGSMGPNATVTISMDLYKSQVENSPSDEVNIKGLKLVTDNLVTAYYEEASANNPAIFSFKGQNALGTNFYIVSQNSFRNFPLNPKDDYESFEIVATENNTEVWITPADDIIGHSKGISFSIILDMGETYSARSVNQLAVSTLAGSHVTSDKPIAITWSDDSIETGGYDVAGDQLVPVSIVGNEYIAIKGFANNTPLDNDERIYLVGTEDGTDVFIDGNLVQTITTGELFSYLIPTASATAYVQTSHPVYVLHLSGFPGEAGASLLPQIFCTGSQQIGFHRTSNNSFALMILTLAGNEDNFTMTPDPLAIQASDFLPVPFTGGQWMYARKTLSTAQLSVGSHLLSNSDGKFHLGIINMLGGSAEYGYFSYFSSINLGVDRTICQGTTTTVDAGFGWATYLWEKEDGASWVTVGTTQTVDISDAGHYRCSVTGQNCSLQDDIQVFFHPVSEPEITGDISVCNNESNVSYNASAPFTQFNWSITGGTFTGQGTPAIVANWTTVGLQTIALTCTNQYGCLVQKNYEVEVHELPNAIILPGGATTVCAGESVNLTAGGGTDYLWSDASTSATITVSNSGTYIVTITDANGCSNTASQLVTVNPLPVAVITPLGATTFCQGGSVNLTASGGTGYLWSDATTTTTISVLASGTYTVTVTGSNGCINTASQAVTVNPLPTAMITPDGATTFCQGGTVGLHASGGTDYHWSNSATTASITVSMPGSYQVTATDINGCISSSSQLVAVNPLPVGLITPNGPTVFCQGGSVILNASGGIGYKWSNSTTASTITVLTSGIYTVTVTDGNGCINSAYREIIVNPLPVTTFTGPETACQDASAPSLYEAAIAPLTTFSWSIPPPYTSQGNITPDPLFPNKAVVNWTGTGTAQVKLEGTTNYGCIATEQKTILIHAKPLVTLPSCFDQVTIPAAKPFLLNGGTPLGSNGVYSGEGVFLTGGKYMFNPASVAGALPISVTITYTYTNSLTCQASDTKVITVVPPPPFQCGNKLKPLRDVRTTPTKTYDTYFIANHCWMSENLDYGTEQSVTSVQTDNCQSEKYCLDASLGGCTDGGFYQWKELMRYNFQEGSQGLCPPGWHIPSSAEWQLLIDANNGNGVAGGTLKTPGNVTGFHALLNGLNYMNTRWAFTSDQNQAGTFFWTSTSASEKPVARGMNTATLSVSYYESSIANAFPVRCVQD